MLRLLKLLVSHGGTNDVVDIAGIYRNHFFNGEEQKKIMHSRLFIHHLYMKDKLEVWSIRPA